jgi:hypothetical protein
MSRLLPPKAGGVKPEDVDPTRVRQYLNNSRWHVAFLVKAFEMDGQKKIAAKLQEALDALDEARDLWTNPNGRGK